MPVWTDVRPLRGAAGLLDWRMCGRLSTMLASGKVTGAEGEQTLFPTAHRLPWRLVLALGVGARRDFSERRFAACVRRAFEAAKGLKARRMAFALPGRDADRAGAPAAALTSRRALDLLLAELDASTEASRDASRDLIEELVVIVPAAVQKELGEVLRLRAVRSAAPAPARPAPRRVSRAKAWMRRDSRKFAPSGGGA